MALLTKEDIIKKTGAAPEKIHVEEWGGEILVDKMSVLDLIEVWGKVDKEDLGAKEHMELMLEVVSRCVVDEKGTRIFEDGDDTLSKTDSGVIKKLFGICAEKMSMTKDSNAALKKNLESITPKDLHTDLQSNLATP